MELTSFIGLSLLTFWSSSVHKNKVLMTLNDLSSKLTLAYRHCFMYFSLRSNYEFVPVF